MCLEMDSVAFGEPTVDGGGLGGIPDRTTICMLFRIVLCRGPNTAAAPAPDSHIIAAAPGAPRLFQSV